MATGAAITSHSTSNPSSRAITYSWTILCLLTIGLWWLSPGHTTNTVEPSVDITTVVIVLGFIKGRLVIRYFMAVKNAPQWLRLSTDFWLLMLWGAVLGIYLY